MVQKLIQQKEVSLIQEEVERACTVQTGEEKAQGGSYQSLYIHDGRERRRENQALFRGA